MNYGDFSCLRSIFYKYTNIFHTYYKCNPIVLRLNSKEAHSLKTHLAMKLN